MHDSALQTFIECTRSGWGPLSSQLVANCRGHLELRTYARVEGTDGTVQLVKRNATIVRSGQVQVYPS